jgi:hypothetical protein
MARWHTNHRAHILAPTQPFHFHSSPACLKAKFLNGVHGIFSNFRLRSPEMGYIRIQTTISKDQRFSLAGQRVQGTMLRKIAVLGNTTVPARAKLVFTASKQNRFVRMHIRTVSDAIAHEKGGRSLLTLFIWIAYDDSASTFTVPTGGGFQVTFCPWGVSTNIIATMGASKGQKGKSEGDHGHHIPWRLITACLGTFMVALSFG